MTRADRLRVLSLLRALAAPDPARILDVLRRAGSLAEDATLQATDSSFLRERTPAAGDAPIVTVEEYIRNTLVRWTGKLNRRNIADRLGLSRKTLWEKNNHFAIG